MKKIIIFIAIIILLVATFLWGNIAFSYCALKITGVDVVKVGYFVDEQLSANINISKGDKSYNVIICNLKPSNFISNGSFSISQLNGYSISAMGCNTAKHKEVFDLVTNQYVGSKWLTNRINFDENSVVNDLFAVKINNISDFIDDIDVIERKLMDFTMVDYKYFINKQEDEIYIKRIKVDENLFKIGNEIREKASLFIFKNADCPCSK